VSLRIDPRGGAVVVTLPPRSSRQAGMALLMNHAHWVAERLAALPDHIPFSDGAEVPINGIAHRIRHVGGRGGVWIEGRQIHVGGDPAFLERRVGDFLRLLARERMSSLALAKAAMARLRPSRVTVKDTRTRWGSCAADRTLSFSWRLLLAPAFVQDYVAAELTPHADAAMEWLRSEAPRLLRVG
jgi:predicted metal-dependent hydrolase